MSTNSGLVRETSTSQRGGKRADRSRVKTLFTRTRAPGVALLVMLAVLWELSVALGWIDILSWSRLSVVLGRLFDFVVSGEIVDVYIPTLRRIAIGYVIAAGIAIPLGILMGYVALVHNLFEPLVETLRPIPIVAYIPVVILFLGIGDAMKIFIVAMGVFFPVLLNTMGGVRSVDTTQVQTGRTFGLNTRKILQHVVLPASLPSIFVGLRISLGIALIVVVVAEMIVSNDGIGFYILNAQRTFRIPNMYVGIISLGVIGYGMNRVFSLVERKVIPWHLTVQE